MAENIEHNLIQLLSGTHFDESTSELCDFTLEEQNAAAEAQGVQPSASSNFVPILGKTVTYVSLTHRIHFILNFSNLLSSTLKFISSRRAIKTNYLLPSFIRFIR